MKASLLVCEAGVIILDENEKHILAKKYLSSPPYVAFKSILNGDSRVELTEILDDAARKGVESIAVRKELYKIIKSDNLKLIQLSEDGDQSLWNNRVRFMMESCLVDSDKDAAKLIRESAITNAENQLRNLSSKQDLQVMQAVQALDEIDKIANTLISRIREWYGLHFPELSNMIPDHRIYANFIAEFGNRSNATTEKAVKIGLTEPVAKSICSAATKSKGAEIRSDFIKQINSLAKEFEVISSIAEKLTSHVDQIMTSFAPNLTAVLGSTISARLMVRAGGLERLARLPASTVQVLGAEKALFRSLRSGGKPPKHGIIFQNQMIHSAPRWQRGKIARSLAGKVYISARVDAFRGKLEPSISEGLEKRFKEIRVKYADPPRVERIEGQEEKWKKRRQLRDRR